MIKAYYAGASGLAAAQENMNVIGNNMANVNTTGYKPNTISFNDLLYSKMYVNSPKTPLAGSGVKATETGIDAHQGTPVPTESELDLAILGNGWFALESDGGTLYTRDGSFATTLSGNTAYLVNQEGKYVLDTNGRRISTTVSQTTTGWSGSTQTSTGIDSGKLIDQVGIFNFTNPGAMTPVSSNSYRANDLSGKATVAPKGENTILSGYLEQSGVSIPDEMVNLITAQRSYQLSARVVQASDEIEQTVNSLRG